MIAAIAWRVVMPAIPAGTHRVVLTAGAAPRVVERTLSGGERATAEIDLAE